MEDLNKLTRVQLCEKLYKFYLASGSTPIGSDKPLSLREYTKRYLKGIGGCKGFKKNELISILSRCLEKGRYC